MVGGRKSFGFLAIAVTTLWTGQAHLVGAPVGTAFTYQGRFNNASSPANGVYDFAFQLYDAATDGNQAGNTIAKDNVDVNDGYFTMTLDFGPGIFTGDAHWLQIAVRPGAETGGYTTLLPRHELTPTPYAISADHDGTPNYVPKFSSSGLADSMIQESNGSVGIGTIAQHTNVKLDILGVNTADSGWANLYIRTSNAPAAGIGGHISFGGKWQETGSATDYTMWAGISGRKENGTSGQYGGYLTLSTRAQGTATAERMRINSSGNVGIGTTSPSQRLHVLSNQNAEVALFKNTGTAAIISLADNTTTGVGYALVRTGDSLELRTLDEPRVTITASGSVGIGTLPLHRFHTLSNQNAEVALFKNTGTAAVISLADGTTAGAGYALVRTGDHIELRTMDTPRLVITPSGSIGVGTWTPQEELDVNGDIRCVDLTEISDEQLKTEVQPLVGVLDKLDLVRAVSFRWNEKAQSLGAKVGAKQIGVLAQEVEQVFPELVTASEPASPDELFGRYPAEMLTAQLRQQLEQDAQRTHYKAVSYSKLTVVLLEAVKELQAENRSLEQRIQALESKAQ